MPSTADRRRDRRRRAEQRVDRRLGHDGDDQSRGPATGDPASPTAAATFTPLGAPVTSILIGSNSRIRATEQGPRPRWDARVLNGVSIPISDEDCDAVAFDNHSPTSAPAGPKPGPAPVNDTPDGALVITSGTHLDAQTGGAALDAEVPITTCPEGPFDAMDRTVWFTFEGTRDPITLDTSGSNFDALIGAYTLDGEDFVEVACIDDVELDPVGGSFQAVLTLDTEEGVAYYAQIGGIQNFFGATPSPVGSGSGRTDPGGQRGSRSQSTQRVPSHQRCQVVRRGPARRRRSGRRSTRRRPATR